MPKTAREQVREIISKINNTEDLHGDDASNYLVKLSSLLSSVGVRIRETELLYIKKKMELRREHDGISMAELTLLASAEQEYRDYNEAKDMHNEIVEMNRSLKYRIKVLRDEREAARNL